MPHAPHPHPDPADAALERSLSQEGLYAFPPALAARIVAEAVGAGRRRLLDVALRAAAAVVLAVAAWAALVGEVPSLPGSSALTHLPQAPVSLPAGGAWASAPAVPGPWAPGLALAALGLVGAGLWLARRWGRAGLRGEGASLEGART